MLALLLSLAFAADLGPEVVPVPPVEEHIAGQCDKPMTIRPGKPLPSGLVGEDGLATCGGTLLPSGTAKFYAEYKAHAEYDLRPALLRANRTISWQEQLYEVKLKQATPRPMERPGVQRMLGRVDIVVAAAVLGGLLYANDRARQGM